MILLFSVLMSIYRCDKNDTYLYHCFIVISRDITPLQAKSYVVHLCLFRNKMIKNWGVIGGIAAAIAAGVYVLWGPITERKKRKRGKDQYDRVGHGLM